MAARIARRVSLEAFEHLLQLSLRFHLERQTGGVSRDIERGSRSIQSLLNYTIYNILPTLVEITMVIVLLSAKFDGWFAAITFGALVLYIAFTVIVTEWRTAFRRAMNEQDSKANTKALDALLNYETVKYFSNEPFEQARYDENLQRLEKASIKSQTSLSLLNLGQSLIIATAVTLLVWRATRRRRRRDDDARRPGARQRADDPALHPAQLPRRHLPRDQAVDDRHGEDVRAARPEPRDRRRAGRAAARRARRAASVRFEDVRFGYDADREILHGVSFEIPAGKTVAVVGPSGSGKSTLARLMFRFYDVDAGRITIDGQDIRA